MRDRIAPRVARFTARRAKPILAIAGVAFIVCVPLGATAFRALDPYEVEDPDTESAQAIERLESASGIRADGTVIALVESESGKASEARLGEVADAMASVEGVAGVIGPFEPPNPALVSRDGTSAFVVGQVGADAESADVTESAEAVFEGQSDVQLGGLVIADDQVAKQSEEDLRRAETIVFPLLFLLSLLFFRGLVAAALPLVLGGVAIVSTLAMMRLLHEVIPLSVLSINVVTGLGFGLAIDYSLFIVSRYREELARSGDSMAALTRALATSGKAVAFSGVTVACAMAALLIFPQQFLYSSGVAGIAVALLCASSALLIMPAALALLGERVNAFAPAWLQRSRAADTAPDERGRWYRLSRWVMRHPGTTAIAAAAVLLALTVPATRIEFVPFGASVLPDSKSAGPVDEAIGDDFDADPQYPIIATFDADVPAPGAPWVPAYNEEVAGLDGVARVAPPVDVGDGQTRIDVFSDFEPDSSEARDLVTEIRGLDSPVPVRVGGLAASAIDEKQSVADHLPLAAAILIVATLTALFVMTGSIVLPVKALLMNLLTLGATLGVLVLVFQDGRLEGLLDYESQGGIQIAIAVLVVVAGFGLSTDYGVFSLSRMRELHDRGSSNEEAVALGLERTGRLITSAALLFAVAMGGLVAGELIGVKEIGLGVAAAVLIDATIVRALLVPSLMALLGDRNWWAPKRLKSLAMKPER